jgi:hypothetical protein
MEAGITDHVWSIESWTTVIWIQMIHYQWF